jgi:hypothetical protein
MTLARVIYLECPQIENGFLNGFLRAKTPLSESESNNV